MVDTLVTGTSNVFYYYRYSITIIDYQVTGTSNALFYNRYYSTMMDTVGVTHRVERLASLSNFMLRR